jgi:hypothetical protein
MPLSSLMNDQVTLVKQDGTRIEKFKAAVQPKLILTDDSRLPIETNPSSTPLNQGLRHSHVLARVGVTTRVAMRLMCPAALYGDSFENQAFASSRPTAGHISIRGPFQHQRLPPGPSRRTIDRA